MRHSLKWKRIKAVLGGGKADRLPFAFWRHFPDLDRDPAKLVQVTLELQHRFDMDLVKVMARSSYLVEGWGNRQESYHPTIGYWLTSHFAIQTPQDWYKLKPLAPDEGSLGEQLNILNQIAAGLNGEVPVLVTLFSPSTLAAQLVGQANFERHLCENPQAVESALAAISQTLIKFGQLALRNGADGVFYAIQEADRKLLAVESYRKIGQAYDLPVLQALHAQSEFVLLHLHGEELMLDEVAHYPAQIWNWHDRGGGPSLQEVREHYHFSLAGGISHEGTLLKGHPVEIEREVADAIAQIGDRGLLLAPGCGLPLTVPEENLYALKEAVLRLA